MGGLADSLGAIAIDIVGDYSGLAADFDAATSSAEQAGEAIAAAFNSSAAEDTAALTDSLEALTPATDDAAEQIKNFNEWLKEAQDSSHKATSDFEELTSKLKELAVETGLTVGFVEALKNSFEAFATVQSATTALTALTGSAETAGAQIDMLRNLAKDENLSFPALLQANQRMVAFGFSLSAIPDALKAAADAAAALNSDITTTASAMDRIAISGMASARQLVQLGLSMSDLADTMGVTADAAKAAFAALDEETRLEVVTAALDKFRGTAKAAASDLAGQWQGAKNAFEEFFATVGAALAPSAGAFLTWSTNVVSSIAEVIDAAKKADTQVPTALRLLGMTSTTAAVGGMQNLLDQITGPAPLAAGALGAPMGPFQTPEQVQANTLANLQAKIQTQLAAVAGTAGGFESKGIPPEVTSSLGIYIEMLKLEESQQEKTGKAIAAYGQSLVDAGVDITGIDLEQAYFNQKMVDGALSIGKYNALIPPVTDDLSDLTNAQEKLGKIAGAVLTVQLPTSLAETAAAYKALGITITDAGDASKKSFDAFNVVVAGSATNLPILDEAWSKIQGQVNTLAKTDMPAAVKLYQEMIDKATELGATEGQILQLKEAQLQVEINQGAMTGADESAQIVRLTQIKDQMIVLQDQSEGLGKVYEQLNTIFMNSFQQFADGMAQAITSSQNFGQAMLTVLKNIENEILKTLIGYVMQQVRDSILKDLINPLTQAQGQVKNLTMSGQQMLEAMNGPGGGAPGALPGAAPTTGGLSSATGAIGTLGAIGSVVGAIAGIVGDIQQAHANKVLGEIELNTRSCFNVLAQMQGSLTGQGPYASLASKMAVSGPTTSVSGGGGSAVNFNNCTFSGLTQDMVNALFSSALRQFKAAGG